MNREQDNTIQSAGPEPGPTKQSILAETSTVPWYELQKLFASGVVLSIDKGLDLVEVAYQMACDNKEEIEALIKQEKILHVTNEQAKHWYRDNTLLWSVVVKPWVLVQDKQKR